MAVEQLEEVRSVGPQTDSSVPPSSTTLFAIIRNVFLQRPLLPGALCFAGGILVAHVVSAPLNWFLLPGMVFALAAILWTRARFWLLWPMCFLAGAANYAQRTAIIAPDDLRVVVGAEPQQAIVRGTLVDTPYQRVFTRDGSEYWRTLARIQVETIMLGDQWTPTVGNLIVGTPDVLTNSFQNGQRVQIAGVIRRPARALAPGLFDYRKYLKTLGIHYQLSVSSTNDWQPLNASAGLPFSARFGAWAREKLAYGLPRDRYVELLWAMTLGWKTALSGEVSEPFMRSGTMHVFAISGLHIALIAAILVAALKVFQLRRPTCAWIVIPLIWGYTWATGWQASAVRSTIMSSVIIAGWCLRRPSNLLNSLMAAGVAILVWDPLQLFQAGFQLSFFVVLVLALLMPPLDRWRETKLAPDPFLPPQFRPRIWRWSRVVGHYGLASFAVSLAAWLGSLPLIANYFHLLTPITLLANMVVVPLSSGALACNLATLAVGWLIPPTAELFNNCAWLLMVLMVKVSEWAADIPALVMYVKSWSLTVVALYYAILITVFSLLSAGLRKWAFGAIAVGAIILFACQSWQREPGSHVTVLPGGSGIFASHGEKWLIDCGANDAGRMITKPFLQAQGIDRLPNLLLTHGDVQHVEAAPLIYETFSVPTIYMSPLRFLSGPYRRTQDYFRTNNIRVTTVVAGDRVGMWDVLHPEDDTPFPQADDKAIVLFGTIHGHRVLLLSDLGMPGQNSLLTRHPNLRADIIVSGLPRESEPLADGFLDVVQAKVIIIADAEQERARERLRDRLAQRGIEVLYTSDTGAITLRFAASGRMERHP